MACRLCHADDKAHKATRCLQRCNKVHERCGHLCPKNCGDECGNCRERVPRVQLPCGHAAKNVECWR